MDLKRKASTDSGTINCISEKRSRRQVQGFGTELTGEEYEKALTTVEKAEKRFVKYPMSTDGSAYVKFEQDSFSAMGSKNPWQYMKYGDNRLFGVKKDASMNNVSSKLIELPNTQNPNIEAVNSYIASVNQRHMTPRAPTCIKPRAKSTFKPQGSSINDKLIEVSKTDSGGGVCLRCGKTYTEYSKCKKHFITAHGETGLINFQCLVCKEGFTFQQNLNDHLRNIHQITGNLTLIHDGVAKIDNGGGVCLLCGSKYTELSKCKKHLREKHGANNSLNNITQAHQSIDSQIDSSPKIVEYPPTIHDNFEATSQLRNKPYLPFLVQNESELAQYNVDNQLDNIGSLNQVEIKREVKETIGPAFNANSAHPRFNEPTSSGNNEHTANLCSKPQITNITYRKTIGNISNSSHGDPEVLVKKIGEGGVCLVCERAFSRLCHCRVHYIKTHGEDGSGDLECLLCNALFRFKLSLKDHMKEKHKVFTNLQRCKEFGEGAMMAKDEKGGGACLKCGRYFSRMCRMKTHFYKTCTETRVIDKTESMKLLEDETYSPKSSVMNLHLANISPIKSAAAKQNISESQIKIDSVIGNIHDDPQILIKRMGEAGLCLVCNSSFSQYRNCRTHFIKKHGENGAGNLECLLCKAIFRFNLNLKDHMEEIHRITTNLKRCEEFGEGAMMAKDEKGGGACLKCGNYYAQFRNMKTHFYQNCTKMFESHSYDGMRPIQKKQEYYPNTDGEQSLGDSINTSVYTAINQQDNKSPKVFDSINIENKKISVTDTGEALCELCGQFFVNLDDCKSHYSATHENLDATNETPKKVMNEESRVGPVFKPIDINFLIEKQPESPPELLQNIEKDEPMQYVSKENQNIPKSIKPDIQASMFTANANANAIEKHGPIKNEVIDSFAATVMKLKYEKKQNSYHDNKDCPSDLATSSALQSNNNMFLTNSREGNPHEGKKYHHSLDDIEYILGNREKPEPSLQISKTGDGGLCLVCGKTFSLFSNCKVHFMNTHAEDGNGHHICIVCRTRFNFEANFRNHMKRKHNLTGNLKKTADFGDSTMMAKDQNGSGVCLVCRQVFSLFSNLKVHYKAKHGN